MSPSHSLAAPELMKKGTWGSSDTWKHILQHPLTFELPHTPKYLGSCA